MNALFSDCRCLYTYSSTKKGQKWKTLIKCVTQISIIKRKESVSNFSNFIANKNKHFFLLELNSHCTYCRLI